MPPPTGSEDDLAMLQFYACRLAMRINPAARPNVVKVCEDKRVILSLGMPGCGGGAVGPAMSTILPLSPVSPDTSSMSRPAAISAAVADEPPAAASWVVTDRAVRYDGRLVPIAASRIGLMRLLVDAREPLAAKVLADDGWLPHRTQTSEANVRRHVAELNRELKEAFPDLGFEPVVGTGAGYALMFR